MSIKLLAKLNVPACVSVSGTTAVYKHLKIWPAAGSGSLSDGNVQWWAAATTPDSPGWTTDCGRRWAQLQLATEHLQWSSSILTKAVWPCKTLFGDHWLRRLTYLPIIASLALLSWQHQSLFLSQSRPLSCHRVCLATISAVEVRTAGLPKTTAWRHRRNLEWEIAPVYQKRKAYTCRKCGQPSTAATGHSKHWAFTYCPNLGKQGRSGWQKLKIWFLVDSK